MDGVFTCLSRRLDRDRRGLRFTYDVPGFGRFEEHVRLPENALLDPLRHRGLIDLVHGVLGVSYFKLAPTDSVAAPYSKLSAASRRLLAAVYGAGLGEFRARNDLPQEARTPIISATPDTPPAPDRDAPAIPRALVALGGGKDSPVALEIAREADRDAAVFCVNPKPLHERTAAAAGAELVRISRRLDRRLGEATRAGGLDGHVPITAVTSVLGVLASCALGRHEVVFANERSADEPTLTIDEAGVNHQWSKSSEFEGLMREALASMALGVDYFSATRPLSELSVAKIFAGLVEQHDVFSSCNRNFGASAEDRGAYWCGECPKCAFVGMILAVFMEKGEITAIFDRHPLENEGLVDLYRDLIGLGPAKPWECVGSVHESAAALWRLSRDEAWADAAICRALAPALRERHGESALETMFEDAMTPAPAPHTPEDYVRAIDRL